MITLYQFACSHFCEKAAWALDYKGIRYKKRNLVPGPTHVATIKKLTGGNSEVPVIVDGEKIIQGSGKIITYLDENYAGRRLTPINTSQCADALEWECYLDRELGVTIRLWFYYHTLPDREKSIDFLLKDTPWYGRPLYLFAFNTVRKKMIQLMNINAKTAAQAHASTMRAVEKIEQRLVERSYLIGDDFTRADLAACALVSPMLKIDREMMTPPIREFRDSFIHGPCFNWVREIYRLHR